MTNYIIPFSIALILFLLSEYIGNYFNEILEFIFNLIFAIISAYSLINVSGLDSLSLDLFTLFVIMIECLTLMGFNMWDIIKYDLHHKSEWGMKYFRKNVKSVVKFFLRNYLYFIVLFLIIIIIILLQKYFKYFKMSSFIIGMFGALIILSICYIIRSLLIRYKLTKHYIIKGLLIINKLKKYTERYNHITNRNEPFSIDSKQLLLINHKEVFDPINNWVQNLYNNIQNHNIYEKCVYKNIYKNLSNLVVTYSFSLYQMSDSVSKRDFNNIIKLLNKLKK